MSERGIVLTIMYSTRWRPKYPLFFQLTNALRLAPSITEYGHSIVGTYSAPQSHPWHEGTGFWLDLYA